MQDSTLAPMSEEVLVVSYAAKSGESRPWFAIGGINEANLGQVLEAGATRIVVVRAVTDARDPDSAVRTLLSRMETW